MQEILRSRYDSTSVHLLILYGYPGQDFIPKLKQHLLSHIRALLIADGSSLEGSTEGNWECVVLKHNRIYKHQTMHINFTTYDIRRADNIINPKGSQYNVMVFNLDISPSSSFKSDKSPF